MEITSEEFMRRLSRALALKRFDVVIGLGRGGVIPGAISAELLKAKFGTVHYEMYGEGMPPPKIREKPKKTAPLSTGVKGKTVLLVDDFCRSGETLNEAVAEVRKAGARSVTTLVVSGTKKADIVLFPSEQCLKMPWKK